MYLPWVALPCPKQRAFVLQPVNWARGLRYLSLIAAVSATCPAVYAAAPPPTVTTLAVTSGAGAVTTAPAGSVVALTATVNAASTPVTVGQVNFCDASASNCTDIRLLGTSQLTSAGTAILRFRPGIGNHSYKAVFAGTNNDAGSSSSPSALSVTKGVDRRDVHRSFSTTPLSASRNYSVNIPSVNAFPAIAATPKPSQSS